MLGLAEPMSCGIGGDLCALVWSAAEERLYGLNACGRSPHGLDRAVFADAGLDRIPDRGPLSWSVPGCVGGWLALHERFGSAPFAGLLAPTIAHARRGVRVPPVIARMWHAAEELLTQDEEARRVYLPHGRAPRAGERFGNPDLGRLLQTIAERGRDGFYGGETAERIASYSEGLGGHLTADDLDADAPSWVEPCSSEFAGATVWELPPSTQGIAVLQMLQILDAAGIVDVDPQTVDYVHWLIEAKKLAYEDRAAFYADPEAAAVPVEALLSPDYARRRAREIDPERASSATTPGALGGAADTVYLTVVDEQRNAISFIQSLYRGFGSGNVPTGLGFALQNRGSLFSLDAHHPNRLEPGKRPFHTIIPGFVTVAGAPRFSFGVMGGDMQPQGQLQVLLRLLLHGADVQSAGDAPRVRHDGSSTPTGDAASGAGTVVLEHAFPAALEAGLRARGHHVLRGDRGFGGYQGIWIDQDGTLCGATERRKDGIVLGI